MRQCKNCTTINSNQDVYCWCCEELLRENGSPAPTCVVVEVRIDGKLHDLWLEGPEHAVRNALMEGSPYQEARVVANPRGYDFGFLDDLISSPTDTHCWNREEPLANDSIASTYSAGWTIHMMNDDRALFYEMRDTGIRIPFGVDVSPLLSALAQTRANYQALRW